MAFYICKEQSKSLKHILSGMAFSCGVPLEEMDLPKSLEGEAFVRELNFHDTIEILYYTANMYPLWTASAFFF